MREIKFRGKDEWKNWRYGDLMKNSIPTDSPVIVEDFYYDDPDDSMFEVDPDTVGQFTGLFDRNGEEIYEGDIVVCVTGRICKVYYFMSPSYCGFDLLPVGGFDCKPPKKSTLWKDLTVIGNVHDSPELLEADYERD